MIVASMMALCFLLPPSQDVRALGSVLWCSMRCVLSLHCYALLSPASSYSDRIFSLSSRANYKDLHEIKKNQNFQRVEKSLLSVKVFLSYCSYRVNEARAFLGRLS